MADASAAEPEEKTRCYICNVKVKLKDAPKCKGKEHIEMDLIPEELSKSLIKSGLWTQEECDGAWIDACFLCSEAASHYFSNLERARYLACPQSLKAALKQIGWIKFRLRKGENKKYKLTASKLKNVDWDTEQCRKYKERWLTTDVVAEPEVEATVHVDPAPQGNQDDAAAAVHDAAGAEHHDEDSDHGQPGQEDDRMSESATSRASSPAVDEDELDEDTNEVEDSEGESERELGSDGHEDENENDEDEDEDEDEDGDEDENGDELEGEHENQIQNPNQHQQQIPIQEAIPIQIPIPIAAQNPNLVQNAINQEAAAALANDGNQGHELQGAGIPDGVQGAGNVNGGDGVEGEGNANGGNVEGDQLNEATLAAEEATSGPLTHKGLAKVMLKIDANHDRREHRRDLRMTELMNARIATVDERFKLTDERHTNTTKSLERLEASCSTLEPHKKALQDRVQACEASTSALRRDHEQVRDDQAVINRAVREDVTDMQASIELLETDMEDVKRHKALIKRLQARIEALEEANEDQPRKRRKLDKGKKKALFAPQSSDSESARYQSEELPEPSDSEFSRRPSEELREPSQPPVKRKAPAQYASVEAPQATSASSSEHTIQTVRAQPTLSRPIARRTGALASGSGARKLIAVEIPAPVARTTASTSATQSRQAAPPPPLPAVNTTLPSVPHDEVDELMSPVADLVSNTAKGRLVESCPVGGAPARGSRRDYVLSMDASGEDETQASASAKKSTNVATSSKPYSFRPSTNLTSPAKRTAMTRSNATSAHSSNAATSNSASHNDDSSIPILDLSGPADRSYPNQAAYLNAQSKPALRPRQSLPTAAAKSYPAAGAGVGQSSASAAARYLRSTELLSFFDESPAQSQDPPATSQTYLQLRNRVIQPLTEQRRAPADSQTETSSSQADEEAVKPKTECDMEDNGEFSASAVKKGKMPAERAHGKE